MFISWLQGLSNRQFTLGTSFRRKLKKRGLLAAAYCTLLIERYWQRRGLFSLSIPLSFSLFPFYKKVWVS
jgi:hypothetical protein